MKKRFVTTLLALIAAIACLIGLVACGDNADPVAGKTYTFEKVQITKGASGDEKAAAETMLNALMAGSTISFDEETFTITNQGASQSGTYKQSGSTITATLSGEDQKIKVSGDTVTMSGTQNGLGLKIIYKLVAAE
ncbi:MAG: hypothetical protein HDP28_02990 [Clostridia bacterium]|nr:hypothetical protein [Clostridia bacterium]